MKTQHESVTQQVADGCSEAVATHLLTERIDRALGGGGGALRVVAWPLSRRDVSRLAAEVFPGGREAAAAAASAWRGLGQADKARRAAGLTTFYRDVPPAWEGPVAAGG